MEEEKAQEDLQVEALRPQGAHLYPVAAVHRIHRITLIQEMIINAVHLHKGIIIIVVVVVVVVLHRRTLTIGVDLLHHNNGDTAIDDHMMIDVVVVAVVFTVVTATIGVDLLLLLTNAAPLPMEPLDR